MSQLNLPHGTNKQKVAKTKKPKSKNEYAQTYWQTVRGESVESVLKKKRKATVGRICRKGRFQAWNERVRGDGIIK